MSGAHPRSRGENETTTATTARRSGSSPLTRGKPVGNQLTWDDGGLIPAHAGKTTHWVATHRVRAAHPRSRGENEIVTYTYEND